MWRNLILLILLAFLGPGWSRTERLDLLRAGPGEIHARRVRSIRASLRGAGWARSPFWAGWR